MKTIRFNGERIEMASSRSYEEVRDAFERSVPMADLPAFNGLVTAKAGVREIEAAVARMAGDSGFMIFAKLDQGPLVSLLGSKKKMTTYLIGNPVIANRMYEKSPATGVYAPLRVSIYEGYDGKVRVTYDLPSALLGQFEDADIRSAGRMLDEKMSRLLAEVTREND